MFMKLRKALCGSITERPVYKPARGPRPSLQSSAVEIALALLVLVVVLVLGGGVRFQLTKFPLQNCIVRGQ